MRRGIMEGTELTATFQLRENTEGNAFTRKQLTHHKVYSVMKHTPMLTGGDFWAVNRSHEPIKSELQSS